MRWIALCFAVVLSGAAAAQAPRVTTTTPVAHSLSAALLADTGIAVDYLPPRRLPVNRIPSWLAKHALQAFPAYEAHVTIAGVWPGDAFGRTLRQSNIRVVAVDIAHARLPKGDRVATSNDSEFFWLNANNLLLMVGVLKRDLGSLWPEHRATVDANAQRLGRLLRRRNLALDQLLVEQGVDALTFAKRQHRPLADGLSVDALTSDEVAVLGIEAVAVGAKAAPGVWVIDDFSRFSEQPFDARVDWVGGLQRLLGSRK